MELHGRKPAVLEQNSCDSVDHVPMFFHELFSVRHPFTPRGPFLGVGCRYPVKQFAEILAVGSPPKIPPNAPARTISTHPLCRWPGQEDPCVLLGIPGGVAVGATPCGALANDRHEHHLTAEHMGDHGVPGLVISGRSPATSIARVHTGDFSGLTQPHEIRADVRAPQGQASGNLTGRTWWKGS